MPTGLRFRNIDASPEDPVESWPLEGVLAALERGTLPGWRRLVSAIEEDPWAKVAREVEEALHLELPYGVDEPFTAVLADARTRAAESERREVADEVRRLLDASGPSRAQFAEGIGTSTSRLSTYVTAKVAPSATLLVRMRRLARGR